MRYIAGGAAFEAEPEAPALAPTETQDATTPEKVEENKNNDQHHKATATTTITTAMQHVFLARQQLSRQKPLVN